LWFFWAITALLLTDWAQSTYFNTPVCGSSQTPCTCEKILAKKFVITLSASSRQAGIVKADNERRRPLPFVKMGALWESLVKTRQYMPMERRIVSMSDSMALLIPDGPDCRP
jgi:hypothetical protein